MKYLFYFFIISLGLIKAQSTYYVSSSGDDKNNGLSKESPWQTINKVNNSNLAPGSVINFRAGDTFEDAILICKSDITYTSYGGTPFAIIGNPNSTNERSILINYKENVTISNLKIYGTANTSKADAIQINSSLVGHKKALIQKDINIKIKNCEIVGGNKAISGFSTGIKSLGGIKGLRILNNTIHQFSEGIYASNPYNVLIESNKIYDIYYGEPSQGIYNNYVRGGEVIELYGNDRDSENNVTVWNCDYTVIIRDNDIYNFETSGVVSTTLSKLIIEYNEVHDNLDERIYHGGIDHAHGLGKLDDFSQGTTVKYPGAIGTIVRYNKIYNIIRHQTASRYEPHANFQFNYRGTLYEPDGALYMFKAYPNIPDGHIPYSLGAAAVDGSGYALQFYGNVVYNCDKVAISRSNRSSSSYDLTKSTEYKNEIYNNTFWNVGYDPLFVKSYGGASIIRVHGKMSPTHVRNNIFYLSNNTGSAIYTQYSPLYEGNNVFFNSSEVHTNLPLNGNHLDHPSSIFVSNRAEYKPIGNKSQMGVPISEASNIFVDHQNGDFRLKNNSILIDAGADLGSDNIGNKISGRGYTSGLIDIGAFEYGETKTSSSPTPVIVVQPTDQKGVIGDSVIFEVTASLENGILGYQWWNKKTDTKIIDGAKYSGATTSKLTVKNIELSDTNLNVICEVKNLNGYPKAGYWLNTNQATINTGIIVYLEAAYKGNGTMASNLSLSGLLPLKQPYNIPPWNLQSTSNLTEINKDYVDWIIIELLDSTLKTIYKKAGLLDINGNILDTNNSLFTFSNITSGNYYLSVKHRNHLPLLSSKKIKVIPNKIINYDFSSSLKTVHNSSSITNLEDGKFAMVAGDSNNDDKIDQDDFKVLSTNIPSKGYTKYDLDMNGVINVLDYVLINKNLNRKSGL